MPYGWHTEAILASSQHWMNFIDFKRVLNTMKFKSYSVKASRDQMRVTLENLPMETPFDVEIRFPSDKIYINLNHSVPNNLLRQLIQALDFNNRQVEKGRNEPDTVDVRSYSNFEDAKVAFYQSLYQLLDICGSLNSETSHVFGIYVQSTFEDYYRLLWT